MWLLLIVMDSNESIPCRIHGKLECSNLEVLRINDVIYINRLCFVSLYIYSSLSKILAVRKIISHLINFTRRKIEREKAV